MSWKRIWTMFKARNYEFFRDTAAFGWNFLFPFLIIAGFAIAFGGRDFSALKVGIFPSPVEKVDFSRSNLPEKFLKTEHLEFIGFPDLEAGLAKNSSTTRSTFWCARIPPSRSIGSWPRRPRAIWPNGSLNRALSRTTMASASRRPWQGWRPATSTGFSPASSG